MTDRRVRRGRQSSNRASMSFLRHREIYQSDELNLRGRNLTKVTPSLIVLMSLRLVIPGAVALQHCPLPLHQPAGVCYKKGSHTS